MKTTTKFTEFMSVSEIKQAIKNEPLIKSPIESIGDEDIKVLKSYAARVLQRMVNMLNTRDIVWHDEVAITFADTWQEFDYATFKELQEAQNSSCNTWTANVWREIVIYMAKEGWTNMSNPRLFGVAVSLLQFKASL